MNQVRLIFALLFSWFPTNLHAQDTNPAASMVKAKVWLEPSISRKRSSDWYPHAITIVSGDIVSFDARQISIRELGDQLDTSLAAAGVLWIELEEPGEKETVGIELFAQKNYKESLYAFLESLKERPPFWRQQWLSMMASQAAWRSDRSEIAIKLVTQLDRRPLPPLVIASLPIAWQNGPQPRATLDVAAEQISDPSPAVRLVAASWLLSSDKRELATRTLGVLSRDHQRPEIAKLAEFVLLRTMTPATFAAQTERWLTKLDALPMVLQVGPTLSIIERLKAADGVDSVAAKRLQLSLQYTPPHPHPDLVKN